MTFNKEHYKHMYVISVEQFQFPLSVDSHDKENKATLHHSFLKCLLYLDAFSVRKK